MREKKPRRLGNYLNPKYGTNFAGNVWDKHFSLPTILTMMGGQREPMVIKAWHCRTK